MTPVAANPEPQIADIALETGSRTAVAQEDAPIPAPSEADARPPTPARLFLDKLGLVEKLTPLRELNRQMSLEHPQFDQELFNAIDENPSVAKRFLKLANGSWFNSRIQVDSTYMAFTRFGIDGFFRLMIGAFIGESIGELSTRFKIWPHLETVARTGETLAQKLAPNLADEIFVAGLLHDAVVPPMQRELQDYLYFVECALGVDPIVTGLESRCHDFDHAIAAGELTSALGFDPAIVEVISAHHNESMSAVSTGNARAILGLLLTTKRALSLSRGNKKNAFETATEKSLLREIGVALNVSTGRIIHAVSDVVESLKVEES
jgi:HD-like signal output (HDOD) protein